MLFAPLPRNEAKRLEALCSLLILDTAPEECFDRISAFAAKEFDVPIALVSLVDRDRQWSKSHFGLEVCETPRDVSFCGHAIMETLSGEATAVIDPLLDFLIAQQPPPEFDALEVRRLNEMAQSFGL